MSILSTSAFRFPPRRLIRQTTFLQALARFRRGWSPACLPRGAATSPTPLRTEAATVIARAVPTVRPSVPSTPSLVGNKRPQPHRFHLTSGRVLDGNLHRAPNARLADHLSTLKGFISVTDAQCGESGARYPYIVLNQDHILFIEELPSEPALAAVPNGLLATGS